MASIQVRKETGRLIIDFYYQGQRCREQTALADTPANRKKLERIKSSPDPELTSGLLRAAGAGQATYSNNTSFDPSQFGKFPAFLESSTEYRMIFSEFAEIAPGSVKADFQRRHQPGESSETPVGEDLKFRQRLPVTLEGSNDALLFRMGAAAGLELDAIVTLTLCTYTRKVKGYTLVRLNDAEATIQALEALLNNPAELRSLV